MTNLLVLLFLFSLILFVVGLIKPSLFQKMYKQANRKNLAVIFGGLTLFFFISVGIFADPVTTDNVQADSSTVDDQVTTGLNNEDNDAFAYDRGRVTNVVDGDTIDVTFTNDETRRIRLIGVDTPETVHPIQPVECFGQEASDFTKESLLDEDVILEADTSQGDLDKYDRLLRYVFLEDGTNFNLRLIAEGYAYEYTYSTPYKYQEDFKTAQDEAEDTQRGLWADGVCESVITPDTSSQGEQAAVMASESDTTEPVTEPLSEPTSTTPSSTPTPSCSCQSNQYNCSDFSTHAGAQSVYDCCYVQVGTDVHKLDRDGDGLACETLN